MTDSPERKLEQLARRRNGEHFLTLEQRVQWLLKHLQFLVGKEDKKKIVSAMKRDGLISKKTYVHDVHLEDAIKQAKFRWYASHNGPLRVPRALASTATAEESK